ncbi:hypothetical protein [Sphingomonas sp. PP-CE-3A-406]|uniref:hypothetical protein n=1 Tax=Sphingomonas sp. PP-CE-3A-406 TaxID=2135659 RepID=UPI0011C37F4E|nr:hypothetical protein [Sphingomonas sp. PP-CE-3A-406]
MASIMPEISIEPKPILCSSTSRRSDTTLRTVPAHRRPFAALPQHRYEQGELACSGSIRYDEDHHQPAAHLDRRVPSVHPVTEVERR